jgi:hypothetical protein
MPSFLAYIKQEQPLLFQQLCIVEAEGLIVLDEKTDSLTATNRLLLTYPGLHDVLSRIINDWAEKRENYTEHFKQVITRE